MEAAERDKSNGPQPQRIKAFLQTYRQNIHKNLQRDVEMLKLSINLGSTTKSYLELYKLDKELAQINTPADTVKAKIHVIHGKVSSELFDLGYSIASCLGVMIGDAADFNEEKKKRINKCHTRIKDITVTLKLHKKSEKVRMTALLIGMIGLKRNLTYDQSQRFQRILTGHYYETLELLRSNRFER